MKHGTTEEHKRQRDVSLKGETPQALQQLNTRLYDKAHPSRGKKKH